MLLLINNLYSYIYKTLLITVYRISGERIINKYIDISLFLIGNNSIVLYINTNAFIIKGIKVGVILNINKLG